MGFWAYRKWKQEHDENMLDDQIKALNKRMKERHKQLIESY